MQVNIQSLSNDFHLKILVSLGLSRHHSKFLRLISIYISPISYVSFFKVLKIYRTSPQPLKMTLFTWYLWLIYMKAKFYIHFLLSPYIPWSEDILRNREVGIFIWKLTNIKFWVSNTNTGKYVSDFLTHEHSIKCKYPSFVIIVVF